MLLRILKNLGMHLEKQVPDKGAYFTESKTE